MDNGSQWSAGSASAPVRRATAPALRRGLDILELFLDGSESLRIPQITSRLELPRATVHELVSTLVDRGYLRVVSEQPTQVALGVKPFQLGGAYERGLDLAELGREAARKVAAKCGETVQLVVRDGTHVVYLVRIDSTHSVRLVSEVGSRLSAHCTAGGKVLLSMLPEQTLAALFPDDDAVIPMTQRSIDTLAQLRGELTETRERGWGHEYCESNVDVACVAAPIFDVSGQCVAAMSISIPTSRWDDERTSEWAELVSGGAHELSTHLGAPASTN